MMLLLLLVVSAVVAGTVRLAVRDGRGRVAPPASRGVDPAFLPPSRLLDRR